MNATDNNPGDSAEMMPDSGNSGFRAAIFRDLEHKLRLTPWNSGASEAHGLLCALACLGVRGEEIRSQAWLFNLRDGTEIDIIEGLYGLVCRDLTDPGFGFALLLPPDDAPLSERAESVSDWCQGFLQGIFHGGDNLPEGSSGPVHEAVADIREIGHLEIDRDDPEGSEKALAEVEEYLRVAAQLVYDELQPAPATGSGSNEIN